LKNNLFLLRMKIGKFLQVLILLALIRQFLLRIDKYIIIKK
jgi:hypothetical protein